MQTVAPFFLPLGVQAQSLEDEAIVAEEVPTELEVLEPPEPEVVVEEEIVEVIEAEAEITQEEVVVPEVEVETAATEPVAEVADTPEEVQPDTVELGVRYTAAEDPRVSVTFTKLPEQAGTLDIKQVFLPADQVESLDALSNVGYDITSSMVNGTFEYTLTLPKPGGESVGVEYSEDGVNFTEIKEGVQDTNEVVVITGLNHFTIFIITDDDAGYSVPWVDYPTQGYGDAGVHYPDTSVAAGETATWTYSSDPLFVADEYLVYVSWSTHHNRTNTAPYVLNHTGGSVPFSIDQELLADQITVGGSGEFSGWYLIGQYSLDLVSNLVLSSLANAGTEYVIADETLLLPAEAPTVDALLTADTTPELTGTIAVDDDMNPTVVTVNVDGNDYFVNTDGSGNWTLADDTISPALTEGVYDVAVSYVNMAGTTRVDLTTDELEIDLTAPVVDVTNPADLDYVMGTVDVRGSVNDLNPWRYYAVVRDMSSTVVAGPGTVYDSNPFTDQTLFSWDTTLVADGDYTVYLAARDLAGNRDNAAGSEDWVTVTVDNTAPVISLDAPSDLDLVRGTISFDTSANEMMENVRFQWKLPTQTWAEANAAGQYVIDSTDAMAYNYMLDTTSLADGDWNLRVAGRDLAHNWSSSAMITIEVDNTPPVVTVDSQTFYSDGTTMPAITGTVDDNDAGIELLIEGNTYAATNNMDGTWTLAANTISPVLAVGVYDVAVTATDLAGNEGYDGTIDELTIYYYGTIQGYKWEDLNGDSVWDSGEPELDGWNIWIETDGNFVYDKGETAVLSGHTGTTGQYRFENLTIGTYHICETLIIDWIQTDPGSCYTEVIDGSGQLISNNFGNLELADIYGFKWEDRNGNGVRNGNDGALENWVIFLDDNDNQVLDSGELSTTTDPAGYFVFSGLSFGTYHLCEVLPPNWVQTTPGTPNPSVPECYEIVIDTSGQLEERAFGNFDLGMIQGRKYEDQDHSGDRNSEPRMDGWMIRLYDSSWNLLDQMETGDDTTPAGNVANGQYRFEGLWLDTYYTCEVLQTGWTQTEPSDTSGNGVVNQSGAGDEAEYCRQSNINRSGRRRTGRTFGNYELSSIGGYKWEDSDWDGNWCNRVATRVASESLSISNSIQAAAPQCNPEQPLENWEIQLWDGTTLLDTQFTDSNGWYQFLNVDIGMYQVCEVMPLDWEQSYPAAVPGVEECHMVEITTADSGLLVMMNTDAEMTNFGNYPDTKPEITLSAVPGTTVLTGTTVTVNSSVVGGDGVLSYVWSGTCSGTGNSSTVATPSVATYICTLTVTDIDGDFDTETIKIFAENGIPDVVLMVNPSTTVVEGTSVLIQGFVVGGDPSFTYAYSGSCTGNGVSSTGTLAATTVPNTPGSYYCRVDVTDTNGDTDAAGVIITVLAEADGAVLGESDQNIDEEDQKDPDEEDQDDKEGSVLGISCDEDDKSKVSGTIYIDFDENGEKDSSDKLLPGLDITIKHIDSEGLIRFVSNVTTDSNGNWEFELCPGDFSIEIDKNDLEEDQEIEDAKISITVAGATDQSDVDFVITQVLDEGSAPFDWTPYIIALVAAILAAIGYWIYRNRQSGLQKLN